MGSARQEDRSLGSGISLPQWMKGKIDNRFDFDESTFSPPSHDDSFFYIRYSKKAEDQSSAPKGFRPIDEVLSGRNIGSSTHQSRGDQQQQTQRQEKEHSQASAAAAAAAAAAATVATGAGASDSTGTRAVDFSKHPLPCQPFIPATASRGSEAKSSKVVLSGTAKAKSQGTDDGFHSEPALCGKSIVHVANQMMSSKFNKMFTSELAQDQPKKGSKSLPATPLASPTTSPDSSPKARRRIVSNRYFTGPFLPDREKYQGGWILSSILGQSREIVTGKIDEEDETSIDVVPPKTLSRKKSISTQNLTYIGKDEKVAGNSAVYTYVFQAKPSELREMNFWSPTSM